MMDKTGYPLETCVGLYMCGGGSFTMAMAVSGTREMTIHLHIWYCSVDKPPPHRHSSTENMSV